MDKYLEIKKLKNINVFSKHFFIFNLSMVRILLTIDIRPPSLYLFIYLYKNIFFNYLSKLKLRFN